MLKSILLGSHDSEIVQIQQTGSMISQQYQLANTKLQRSANCRQHNKNNNNKKEGWSWDVWTQDVIMTNFSVKIPVFIYLFLYIEFSSQYRHPKKSFGDSETNQAMASLCVASSTRKYVVEKREGVNTSQYRKDRTTTNWSPTSYRILLIYPQPFLAIPT